MKVKKNYLLRLLVAAFALLPLTAVADVAESFTAAWELKTSPAVTTATASKDGLFSVAELSWGDKLEEKGVRTDGDVSRLMFQPTEVAGSRTDANALVFTLKPKKALTFTPKTLSFNASKVGTNGGCFDVVVVSGEQETVLAENIVPQLAKTSPYVSNHTFDLSDIPSTDDIFYVKIYIKNVAVNKQYAFSDVTVTGDVAGEIEAVPTYMMSVKLGMDNAGKVTLSPAGSEFDEGTIITVGATENFGYHFKGWTDEQGNVVSTMNPYTFDISANTALIASYDKVDTYALNLNLEGGANDNLVRVVPAVHMCDCVHW